MISNFFTPTSVTIIILGVTFLTLTRKAWNKVVERAAIEIKNKLFSFRSTNQEQRKVIKDNKESSINHKEFQKLLKKLNINDFNEFNTLLTTVVQKGISNENRVKELEIRLNTVFGLWKFYMFSYLNRYLVPNTKIALLWLYNHSNSTKEMFQLNIYLSSQILNPALEKEAIFNSLVLHNLIVKDDRDLYMATNIGRDFLVFIGLIRET